MMKLYAHMEYGTLPALLFRQKFSMMECIIQFKPMFFKLLWKEENDFF